MTVTDANDTDITSSIAIAIAIAIDVAIAIDIALNGNKRLWIP